MLALTTVTMLWCACSVAAELTAEQILEKSEAAYLALKSYEGTTTVNSVIDAGSLKMEQTAAAKITFARPGKIRIEGTTTGTKSPALPRMAGNPYAIVSDGKRSLAEQRSLYENRRGSSDQQHVRCHLTGCDRCSIGVAEA